MPKEEDLAEALSVSGNEFFPTPSWKGYEEYVALLHRAAEAGETNLIKDEYHTLLHDSDFPDDPDQKEIFKALLEVFTVLLPDYKPEPPQKDEVEDPQMHLF